MKQSIRHQLAVATTALLSVGASDSQAADSDKASVGYSQLHYAELDRITVDKTTLEFNVKFNETLSLNTSAIYDTMSGATPNGRIFTADADTGAIPITTASGFSFTTAASTSELSNQPGLTPFSDERIAFSASVNKQAARLLSLTAGTSYSVEHDYRSFGLSGLLSRDSAQRHTSVNVGGSLNIDKVSPDGGIVAGFGQTWCTTNVVLRPDPNIVDCDNNPLRYQPADKYSLALLFGFNKVINRSTISQFNIATNYSNGYLSDPYKLVSVLDDSTVLQKDKRVEVAVFHEQRPRKRFSYSAFWKLVTDLDGKSLHLSNRYFSDDWGIKSNTTDIRLHWQVLARTYVVPHLRFSIQSAADFYRDYYYTQDLISEKPEFASADHRLSAQSTSTAGIKITQRVENSLELSARAEYMYQNYQTTLMPNMHALIVQFIVSSKL